MLRGIVRIPAQRLLLGCAFFAVPTKSKLPPLTPEEEKRKVELTEKIRHVNSLHNFLVSQSKRRGTFYEGNGKRSGVQI